MRFLSTKNAFSLFEILFTILITSILCITVLKSITALKKQNHSIHSFLLTHASLFETQLFLNRQFSVAKPTSFNIANNQIQWEGHYKLFLPAKQNSNSMDFSLQTETRTLTYTQNNLYFNQGLLLQNVHDFTLWFEQSKNFTLLRYKICTQICIEDFVLFEKNNNILSL